MGNNPVYFQPPENVKLQYPCIIYSRSSGDTKFANNDPYVVTRRYNIQLIDRNPDSPYIKDILQLRMCKYDRHYVADNLNHDTFNLYF